MRRRSFLAFSAACALCGCSGAMHELPQVSESQLRLAQSEVRERAAPLQRRHVTDEEADAGLQSALRRIFEPAQRLCHEMKVGVCGWDFRSGPDRSLDAGAGRDGLIVVNRGVVDYAANEEQVCLVIAHEIGHQAANHIANAQRNRKIGATIGAALLDAAMAIASGNSPEFAGARRSMAQLGANVGARLGRFAFSKEQEREADYLAALILYRAGVDLDQARGLQVAFAWDTRHDGTGWFDTHPLGADRLAAWDRAVAEIRASNGRLPQKAS